MTKKKVVKPSRWEKIKKVLLAPVALIKKCIYDMASTCYEDQDFEVMSLPRLGYFLCIWLYVICTLAEVFGGYKVNHYDLLVGAMTAAGATYASKKFIDRRNGTPGPPTPPSPSESEEPPHEQ